MEALLADVVADTLLDAAGLFDKQPDTKGQQSCQRNGGYQKRNQAGQGMLAYEMIDGIAGQQRKDGLAKAQNIFAMPSWIISPR